MLTLRLLQITEVAMPEALQAEAEQRRQELVEAVADVDDEVADLFLAEAAVPGAVLHAAVRRATVARTFIPVFMGSAYRNVGVQPLLDGVSAYLPSPTDVRHLQPPSPPLYACTSRWSWNAHIICLSACVPGGFTRLATRVPAASMLLRPPPRSVPTGSPLGCRKP